MSKLAILILPMFLVGCHAPVEPGYHHLMRALMARNACTNETLEHDGQTCYRVRGEYIICGFTRDSAADSAAIWVEHNIPLPDCCGK